MTRPGHELPLLLIGGFREVIDAAHRVLDERGFPEARPRDGFAMQAVGSGATTGEIAARLGVSKQAAAKTVARLVDLDYVTVEPDPADGRRKLVRPSARGGAMLRASADAFSTVRDSWARRIGAHHLDTMLDDLAALSADTVRLDTLGLLDDGAP